MKRRYYEITPPAENVMKRRIEMGRSVAQNNAETLRLQMKRTDRYLDLLQQLEYDPVRTERRIQAAANTFEMALTVTTPVFPERPPMTEEVWMCGCMEPCYGYDCMDKDTTFTLACAIWMLDQLEKCGRLAEAAACFPEDDRVYDQMHLPPLRDIVHDERSVKGMLWVINHRNDDCTGLQKKIQKENPRALMDLYTAKGMHHQQVPSRERFETILGMIPQQEVEAAVQRFEEDYDEVLRLVWLTQLVFDGKITENNRKRNELRHELWQLRMGEYHTFQERPNTDVLLQRRHDLTEALVQTNCAYDELYGLLCRYTRDIGRIHLIPAEERRKVFGEDVAYIWENIQVTDPYGLAFAFLYLLDNDSDLPWTYHVTGKLMGFCGCQLPWIREVKGF